VTLHIFRIGIAPKTVLPLTQGTIDLSEATLKQFDYVLLGYATTKDGLLAPYDEENTRELFKVERCEDPFEFWKAHPNRELYTAKHVELQAFGDGT
jgi:hypothetical protein